MTNEYTITAKALREGKDQMGTIKPNAEFSTFIGKNVAEIPVDILRLANYQRETNKSRAKKIAKSYDVVRQGLVTVSYRDGEYWIVDGGHRVQALRELGEKTVLCFVLKGLTYQEEAHYFRTQHGVTTRLSTVARFRAGVEEGDPEHLAINEILGRTGFRVSRGGGAKSSFDSLQTVELLFTIYKDYSPAILEETLKTIRRVWYPQAKGKHGFVIYGMAEFIYQSMKQGKYNPCEIQRKLSSVPPDRIISISASRISSGTVTKTKDGARQAAIVIAEQYNYHRREGSNGYVVIK